jgi:hypothetical protein
MVLELSANSLYPISGYTLLHQVVIQIAFLVLLLHLYAR